MKKLLVILVLVLGYFVSNAQNGYTSYKYSGTIDTSKVMFEFRTDIMGKYQWDTGEFSYKLNKKKIYEFSGEDDYREYDNAPNYNAENDNKTIKLKLKVTCNKKNDGYFVFDGSHSGGCNKDKKVTGKWYAANNKVYDVVLTFISTKEVH